jgi:nitroreductase
VGIFQAPSEGVPAEAGTPEEIARFVVSAAVHAPSVHNTQPWCFSHDEREISVHAHNERQLRVADPHGREMMISCGAALFTVRVALRNLGFVPRVRVLPDPDLPNLVARVAWGERVPPVEYEKQLFAEIPRRRTHRGAGLRWPLTDLLIRKVNTRARSRRASPLGMPQVMLPSSATSADSCASPSGVDGVVGDMVWLPPAGWALASCSARDSSTA